MIVLLYHIQMLTVYVFLMFKLVIFGVCEEHQRVDRIMKNYNKNNKIVSYKCVFILPN